MAELVPVYTDAQILTLNERAIAIFILATEDKNLSPVVEGNVYQGILNMCGQVEAPKVQAGTILPHMDVPRGRG